MKPGMSRETTVVLPSRSASARVVSYVASDVGRPRMISTSFMIGGGFMKCMPITRSGRVTAAPIAVMLIDDVLVARITPGRHDWSSIVKISRLTSGLSVAASTTKSTLSRSPP